MRARQSGSRAGALPAPRKRFGQHFLRDERTLDAIVEALGAIGERTVVEIGPGRGALTDKLAQRARRVVAIEIDRDLVQHLRARYGDGPHSAPHVRIVEADVLSVSLGALAEGPYVLAANVPYYITTPILFHALQTPRPEVAVYLVQKEVAERMCAEPGSKVYGALSVNLQALAAVEYLRTVPAGAFHPPPKVESAVVRVIPRAQPLLPAALEARFQTVVIQAFGLRRKQMVRVLRTITAWSADDVTALLTRCGIAPDARPEVLSPADWVRVVTALDAVRSGQVEQGAT